MNDETQPSVRRLSHLRQYSGFFKTNQSEEQQAEQRCVAFFQCLANGRDSVLRADNVALGRELLAVGLKRRGADSVLNAVLDQATNAVGEVCLCDFISASKDNRHFADHLAADLQRITGAWFTGDKWRMHVQLSKFALPAMHIVLALVLTVEHFRQHMQLSTLAAQLTNALTAAFAFLLRPLSPVFDGAAGLLRPLSPVREAALWRAVETAAAAAVSGEALQLIVAGLLLVVLPSVLVLCMRQPPTLDTTGGMASPTRRAAATSTRLLGSLLQDVAQDSIDEAFEFFDLENSYVARHLRPLTRLHKSWHCALIGMLFVLVLLVPDSAGLGRVSACAGDAARCVAAPLGALISEALFEVHESLYLAQYWAYCLVFLIRVLNAACSLSADYQRSLEMDACVLGVYRFEVPSAPSGPSAKEVYSWLLRARLPLVFEASRVFWDSIKRYCFTPCCVLYALLPLAFAIWHPHWAGQDGWWRAGHFARGVVLLLPNLTTAFLFQSYMLNIAAAVRKKLYAMKGLTFMLSPVGALVVGLPSVDLRHPKTLVAWLKLRAFVASSFEAAGMVAVEIGFIAIVALIVLLQVALYYTVSVGRWTQASLVLYFYLVCFTYGFGALGVAMTTVHEKQAQLECLERRRRDLIVQCYFQWDERSGTPAERASVKDIAFQLKDVISSMRDAEKKNPAGLPLSNTALFLLRSFLITMLSATLSKLPVAIGVWELIQAQPGLSTALGPAQTAIMGLLKSTQPLLSFFGGA